MTPTSIHIIVMEKSPKTFPRNGRGATTFLAKSMKLSTSPLNTKEHQIIMLIPSAMTAEIQRHTLMCHKTPVHQDNNHRFDNMTYLQQLSEHWKGDPMLLPSRHSTTKTTTTAPTITMIGELEHIRLLSISGFANLNTMKSVLGG